MEPKVCNSHHARESPCHNDETGYSLIELQEFLLKQSQSDPKLKSAKKRSFMMLSKMPKNSLFAVNSKMHYSFSVNFVC